MSENDENSFPWQRQLSDSNPMFAAVINASRPASWRKNGEDRSRSLLFEQIGAEGVVAYKAEAVFGSPGHPRSLRVVPSDRRQNFLHFLFPGPCAYLASFWSYGEKKRNFKKRKLVAIATSLKKPKIEVLIDHLQPQLN